MKNILLIGMVLLLIGCGSQSNNDYARLHEENNTEFNNSDISQWDNNASNDNYEDESEQDVNIQQTVPQQNTYQQPRPTEMFKVMRYVDTVSSPYHSSGYADVLKISVTSKTDGPITVMGIIINRGNCHVLWDTQPFTLRYGETHSVSINNDCDVLEVTLQTDSGDFGFAFE